VIKAEPDVHNQRANGATQGSKTTVYLCFSGKIVRIPRRQAIGNDESFLSSRMAARLPQRGEILAFLWST
jgi:hypothetical protein